MARISNEDIYEGFGAENTSVEIYNDIKQRSPWHGVFFPLLEDKSDKKQGPCIWLFFRVVVLHITRIVKCLLSFRRSSCLIYSMMLGDQTPLRIPAHATELWSCITTLTARCLTSISAPFIPPASALLP